MNKKNELRAKLQARQHQHQNAPRAKRPALINAGIATAPTKRPRMEAPKRHHLPTKPFVSSSAEALGAGTSSSSTSAQPKAQLGPSLSLNLPYKPMSVKSQQLLTRGVEASKSLTQIREQPSPEPPVEAQKEVDPPEPPEIAIPKKLASSDEATINELLTNFTPEEALQWLQSYQLSPMGCAKLIARIPAAHQVPMDTAMAVLPFLCAARYKAVDGIDKLIARLSAQLRPAIKQMNAESKIQLQSGPPHLAGRRTNIFSSSTMSGNESGKNAAEVKMEVQEAVEEPMETNQLDETKPYFQFDKVDEPDDAVKECARQDAKAEKEIWIPKEIPFLGMLDPAKPVDIPTADRILAMTISECFDLIKGGMVQRGAKQTAGGGSIDFDSAAVTSRLEQLVNFAKSNPGLLDRQLPLLATKVQNLVQLMTGREIRGGNIPVLPLLLYTLDMLSCSVVCTRITRNEGAVQTQVWATLTALKAIFQVFQNRNNRKIPFLTEKTLQVLVKFLKNNQTSAVQDLLAENLAIIKELLDLNRQLVLLSATDRDILKRELANVEAQQQQVAAATQQA